MLRSLVELYNRRSAQLWWRLVEPLAKSGESREPVIIVTTGAFVAEQAMKERGQDARTVSFQPSVHYLQETCKGKRRRGAPKIKFGDELNPLQSRTSISAKWHAGQPHMSQTLPVGYNVDQWRAPYVASQALIMDLIEVYFEVIYPMLASY
jgi:hypothetical protein